MASSHAMAEPSPITPSPEGASERRGSSLTGADPSRRPPARRVRFALAGILALGFLVRAAHLAAVAGSDFPRVQLAISGADTSAHWKWSQEIQDGDWLGRNTFHQYTDWMREIAPLETWYRWWGGEKIFYREPVYPYFLALVRSGLRTIGAGDSLLAVFGVQLLIGVVRPLLLFALGRRLLDERAGLVAATVGAIYGPFVFFEASLLRDWMPPILDPLLLLALLRARDTARTRDWILAGVLFGASVLVRSSILLFLPLCLLWIAWEAKRALPAIGHGAPVLPQPLRSQILRPIGLLLFGLALGLAPLVVRNLAVGAPALAVTNRAPEAIVESNAADSTPVGMPIPASMPAILEEAQGSALRAAVSTVEQYRGHWGDLARVQWLKLWGAFDPREHSDNLDYEYGRAISPVLRFSPGFASIGLFGVAGLALFLRRGGAHRLVLLYVVSVLGAQLVTVIVGRYRLGMVAVLIATGAAYLVTCWDRLRGPAPGRALPALAILPVLLGAHITLEPRILRDPSVDKTSREIEYQTAVKIHVQAGRFEEALAEVKRFRERSGDRPDRRAQAGFMEGFTRCAWSEALLAAGRTADARAQAVLAAKAFDVPGQDPSAWFQLGRVFLELGGRAEAEKWLERYVVEARSGPFAVETRRLLEIARQGGDGNR
jgi:hypothetical protein